MINNIDFNQIFKDVPLVSLSDCIDSYISSTKKEMNNLEAYIKDTEPTYRGAKTFTEKVDPENPTVTIKFKDNKGIAKLQTKTEDAVTTANKIIEEFDRNKERLDYLQSVAKTTEQLEKVRNILLAIQEAS